VPKITTRQNHRQYSDNHILQKIHYAGFVRIQL